MELNPIIIGIAGGTGSGKSTLADNIRKEFANNITMLSHDYYYKSNSHLSFDERKKLNYDHPDALVLVNIHIRVFYRIQCVNLQLMC